MSLKKRYRETIQHKLLKDLSLTNIHEVPKVVKVTVNRGLGEAATNAKSLEASVKELAQITGQKVVVTRAKKSNRSLQNPPGHAYWLCRHPAR
jgi:large subunit ribosomal protein L5